MCQQNTIKENKNSFKQIVYYNEVVNVKVRKSVNYQKAKQNNKTIDNNIK